MVKKILLAAAAIVVLFVIVVALRPSAFSVERSIDIEAPASAAFPHVNDLRQFERWNPWAKLDPNLKTTVSGPPSGVGAVYAWEGNSQVGKGRQTIVESIPDRKVGMKLEFFEPMEGTNDVVFLFDESPGTTRVTWRMSGDQNFVMKGMSMFMDMDRMIGDQFNQGLTSLKQLAESSSVSSNS